MRLYWANLTPEARAARVANLHVWKINAERARRKAEERAVVGMRQIAAAAQAAMAPGHRRALRATRPGPQRRTSAKRDFILNVLSEAEKENWWNAVPQNVRDDVVKLEGNEDKKK